MEQLAQAWGETGRPPRVIIENATPEVDGGRYAVKRTAGQSVVVEADIFADGHDELACKLQYRKLSESEWSEVPMQLLGNDRWQGRFSVTQTEDYVYRLEAWPDRLRTWQRDLKKRMDAGQDVALELKVGAELIREAAARATEPDAARLRKWADEVEKDGVVALDEVLTELAQRYPDRSASTVYDRGQRVSIDRRRAEFSTWYEMFPRSASPDPGRPGTFRDVIDRLPYVASMGFDVLYLPPIHPIGRTNRKGRNNNPVAEPDAVGSPWGIGSAEGGHKAVNPVLGTLEDFRDLVKAANRHDIEVALDIAFQCSPDHPYVKEHPQWFRHRPDGSIRYAENPPKRYEDIYPIDFETEDWQALWLELESVVRFWIDQGVRIFRVDNPHTKAFAFWEWLLARTRIDHPEVIYLAEAFARPRTMHYLAKIGFAQSYTYFTWRNNKWDLSQYLTELTQSHLREFYRPNFWPNTPDILNEYLQFGGRPAFITRLVLAATASSNYGIYGPPYELCVNVPRDPGSEEYLDSEKYEVRHWDLDAPQSLRDIIARINRARRDHQALQQTANLRLLEVSNDQMIAYMKTTPEMDDIVVVVANLDPNYTQSGWLQLPLADLELDPNVPYQMHDMLDVPHNMWHGEWNYIELNPHVIPAHVFILRRHMRSEQDFDYFL